MVFTHNGSAIYLILFNFSIDASKESGRLGRLVNHGNKNQRNAAMKEHKGQLVLFAIRYVYILSSPYLFMSWMDFFFKTRGLT